MSAKPDFLTIDQKLLHVTYEKWPEYFKDVGSNIM